MRHWTEDCRGASCGAALGDDDILTPSMSEPNCGVCQAIVQLTIDCIGTREPRDTLPGRPTGPRPAVVPMPADEDDDDVVTGEIVIRPPPPCRPMTEQPSIIAP